MAIKSGQKIPVGTVAVLNQVSLLGEQYIDLHFPAHFDPTSGPWLKSGDQVPTSSTQGVEQFVNQASNLVGAIDAGDLAASFQALDEGLAGRGPALNQIIASLTQVAHAINGQSGDLATIIDGLAKLGTPLANGTNQIGALLDSLATSTGLLATDRQKIISSIGQLTRLAGDLNREVLLPHLSQIETLLGQLDPVLGSLAQSRSQLGDLASKLKIFVDQIPKAVYNSTILFYAWLAGTVKPGGGTDPLPVVGTPLLQSLLGPH
jgi:phospholipid/cholesterol/gamma-HCH transport system substrate-binding protein